MIPVEKFWKQWHKGRHQTDMDSKTLVLVDSETPIFSQNREIENLI